MVNRDILEKVLERLATTEKTTIVIGASVGRQNSRHLKALGRAKKVFLRAQVLGPATVPVNCDQVHRETSLAGVPHTHKANARQSLAAHS
jgi:hypothetical protein